MNTTLTAMETPLKTLELHPLNARANAPETYTEDDIQNLAASIRELGLINPIVVQKIGKTYGVIAGGRRLAALRLLAADKACKGWTQASKIACRELPEDLGAATAITVAENVTQKPMNAIDEFEAFARMLDTGQHTPESVAKMFGVDRRRVVDRMRFGRIHPDIRAAARKKVISLDVMKAFADNPDHDAQASVFEAMQQDGRYWSAYNVRNALSERGLKISDTIGALVAEDYKAANGAIKADLLEEDTVLLDGNLVGEILDRKLAEAASAECDRLGCKWWSTMREIDYDLISKYGRVYTKHLELSEEEQAQADALADKMSAIEQRQIELENGAAQDNDADHEALEEEWEALEEAYEQLTVGFSEDDLAVSGVIAGIQRGEITLIAGLVKDEDKRSSSKTNAGSPSPATGVQEGAGPIAYADSLTADLRTEQAMIVGNALAANPALAHDLLLFKLITDTLIDGVSVSYALGINATKSYHAHGKPEGIDGRLSEMRANLTAAAGLDEIFQDKHRATMAQFEAFRELPAERKSALAGLVLAESLNTSRYERSEAILANVASAIVPDVRAVWRPTGEAFFNRLKKADLLTLLASDLKLPEEAARLASGKKSDIVAFLEKLFASPFATLSEEQREAVETWLPSIMKIAPVDQAPAETDEEDPEIEDEDFDIGVHAPAEAAEAA